MKSKLLLFSIAIILLSLTQSCRLQFGTLQFDAKQADMLSSDELVTFIRNHPKPTIVVRTKETNDSIIAKTNAYYNYLMEKELVKSGFKVKDAELFSKTAEKANVEDYKRLNVITGVDLILELVRIKKDVPYTTEIFYTKNNEKRELNNYQISRNGAIIEFKLVLVGNNKAEGLYTFYYTPCSSKSNNGDCGCILGYKNGLNKIYPEKNWCRKRINPELQSMDESLMEDFFTESVQNIIFDIKGVE